MSPWVLTVLFATMAIGAIGGFLVRRYRVSQASANLPDRTTPRSPSAQFGRQAALILGPVLLLAGAGFWALSRDHRWVEQEARARAAEESKSLADQLGQRWASELAYAEFLGRQWEGDGVPDGPAGMPSGPNVIAPGAWPASAGPRSFYEDRLSEWRQNFPGLEFAEVFPVYLEVSPSDTVPTPADWLDIARPQLIRSWEELLAAAGGSDNSAFETARDRFLQLDPSPQARANLEYLVLRRFANSATPDARSDITETFRAFAADPRNLPVTSPAGLPLAAVAAVQGLRWLSAQDFDARWLWTLNLQVLRQPSLLSPSLLEAAERLVATRETEWQEAVGRLRERYRSYERRRTLGYLLRTALPLETDTLANVWLDYADEHWLVLVHPRSAAVTPLLSTQSKVSTAPVTEAFPRRFLERALERAAKFTFHRRSPWTKWQVELEGQRFDSLATWSVTTNDTELVELAKVEAPLSVPLLGIAGADSVERFPSRPRLSVTAILTDRRALYARQRQREWLFGGLILGAVGAAFVGVRQVQRTVRQQVALTEQKTNFVSGVSHELRAPIASMRLLAEALERGAVTTPERQREYHGLIVSECRRLGGLVENVLGAARIDEGRQTYTFEPTDLPQLVRETVRVMEPLAAEQRVTLRTTLPEISQPSAAPRESGAQEPCLDGAAVHRALVNLLDNALKHSPPGAEVHLGVEIQGPPAGPPVTLRFWVDDAGPGVPEAERERIFERFHRLGSELRRETPGVGLGLAIVRRIAGAHGGRVRVERRPDGATGAHFVLELPWNSAAIECRESS